jgi:hypothetical protein
VHGASSWHACWQCLLPSLAAAGMVASNGLTFVPVSAEMDRLPPASCHPHPKPSYPTPAPLPLATSHSHLHTHTPMASPGAHRVPGHPASRHVLCCTRGGGPSEGGRSQQGPCCCWRCGAGRHTNLCAGTRATRAAQSGEWGRDHGAGQKAGGATAAQCGEQAKRRGLPEQLGVLGKAGQQSDTLTL